MLQRMHGLVNTVLQLYMTTERRRAAWWSGASAAFSVAAHRTQVVSWLGRMLDALGRACLRRSVRLHHRRSVRMVSLYHQRAREQALPLVLRPSEVGPYRSRPDGPTGPVGCAWSDGATGSVPAVGATGVSYRPLPTSACGQRHIRMVSE